MPENNNELLDQQNFISIEEATAISVSKETFDKEFSNLKEELKQQKSISWQIVLGVGIAFLFTIGLIAIDIFIFHSNKNNEVSEIKININTEITELKDIINKEKLKNQQLLHELELNANKQELEIREEINKLKLTVPTNKEKS